MPSNHSSAVATLYIRWTFVRAVLHRGWWLVTSLYLVVEANLAPLELVALGTAQGLIAFAFEIPTGVVADTWSRKGSIVIAHLVMGVGMIATGLATSFPALVVTQMLWGLAWTFSSGADVAWITDELDDPPRVGRVLTIAARWEQIGSAVGLIVFGAIAWATHLALSIVLAGGLMLLLGVFVAIRFGERNFVPTHERRYGAYWATLRNGFALARRERTMLVVLLATVLVNGAHEAFGRLIPKRLIELGLPASPAPIVWLTGLGLIALVLGAFSLRVVESRIDGMRDPRGMYAVACIVGALGILLFAIAPDYLTAMAGVLVMRGIALSVIRVIGVIWVNRSATTSVRATLQSFLAQAEYLGEICFGFALGVIAQVIGIETAMFGACALVASAGVLSRLRGRLVSNVAGW